MADLAEELDLSKNAVRSHLTRLGRDGLVTEMGKRPSTRKPETLFGLTEEAEALFPKAYDVLVGLLVEGIEERISEPAVEDLLDEVGRKLAERVGPSEEVADLDARTQRAREILNELGGEADIRSLGGGSGYLIEGYSCPLGSVVADHPDVCRVARTLLAEITGAHVEERCEKQGTPHCRFEIRPTSPTP